MNTLFVKLIIGVLYDPLYFTISFYDASMYFQLKLTLNDLLIFVSSLGVVTLIEVTNFGNF